MAALVFVDTSLLLYARDTRDAIKRATASEWMRMLWSQERGRTSVQVLIEYYEVITRRFPAVRAEDVWEDVRYYLSAWNPQPLDSEVLDLAHDVESHYRLSWWDCLIVGAAQAQNCLLLLSEDLQDGAEYGGVVVRSPFTLRIADEAAAYSLPPRQVIRHRGRGRPRRDRGAIAGSSG
jgi:predicted nucleic acid-binding protein